MLENLIGIDSAGRRQGGREGTEGEGNSRARDYESTGVHGGSCAGCVLFPGRSAIKEKSVATKGFRVLASRDNIQAKVPRLYFSSSYWDID